MTKIQKKKYKLNRKIPILLREKLSTKDIKDFPVDHYSYSSFVQITSNPIMFKIKNINGDRIETTSRASNVLGRGVHNALQHYFGGCDNVISNDEGERIKEAFVYGQKFVLDYNDGFIEWTTAIPNRTTLEEKYSKCFFGYMKEFPKKEIKAIWFAEKMLKHKVNLDGKTLPIPLKGSADLVYEDQKGRIVIWDHKFTSVYSKKDEIDAPKLVQAVFNFLLVYAETGIAPYKMVFAEYKTSDNRDKSSQMMPFEIIFKDTPLMFELFYRLYEDITDMLMGIRQPFLPNLTAMYDKEVSIISYIHNLDDNVNRDKQFKKMDVNNITDLLKKKIEKTGNMKKYLEIISKNFISANTLNYKNMNTQDKIKMKLAEHGIAVEFVKLVSGSTVDMYLFEPSIGIKMSRITGYFADIEQVVGVSGVRILAPVPNTVYVGFEVPKTERVFPVNTTKSNNIIAGIDIYGDNIELIVEEMPHLLVAGTTGSGKSIFLKNVVEQMKNKYKITIFDPKGLDFEKSVTDKTSIAESLKMYVAEMNERYAQMKELGVKKWSQTGKKSTILIIDEYNDLCMSSEKIQVGTKTETKIYAKGAIEVEKPIYDTVGNVISHCVKILAQKARASGIHIILATQRPSVKVIDGDIKANFPTRISFRLHSEIDSKVVLDQGGAEKLQGKGDGLLSVDGKIIRFQGFNL
jgi:hypothetical protein